MCMSVEESDRYTSGWPSESQATYSSGCAIEVGACPAAGYASESESTAGPAVRCDWLSRRFLLRRPFLMASVGQSLRPWWLLNAIHSGPVLVGRATVLYIRKTYQACYAQLRRIYEDQSCT